MGSCLVSTHRKLVRWQELLLAVSLLTFWSLTTMAQFAIETTRVGVGWDATLQLRNIPPDAYGFKWYKGEGENFHLRIGDIFIKPSFFLRGPKYRKRARMLSDGSLLIKKVTMKDRGMFTTVAYLPNRTREIGFGQLIVYEPVKSPILLSSNYLVTEDKDAVSFTCNTTEVSIQWLFNGENLQLSERMKLSQDRRNLTINPVKRKDDGYYQCEVSNPISSADSWVRWLHVKYV